MSATTEFLKRAHDAADRQLKTAALFLQYEIQQELSKPGTGRVYRVRKARFGKPGANGRRKRLRGLASEFHRASAPGNPPAPDTGTLKRSAFTEKAGVLRYEVGVATKYADDLELHKNRPFMRTALKRWLGKIGGRP